MPPRRADGWGSFCCRAEEVWCRTTPVFARHLVESASLTDDALELSVRLNWYRSLPLSCVEQLEVRLDGVDLLPATVELDGVRSPVADLPTADDRWWHVLDSARVRVPLEHAPVAGRHEVELVLGSRIPYLVSPDGSAAVIVDRARAEVVR
jgi:Domain of unknown function (DUF6379)